MDRAPERNLHMDASEEERLVRAVRQGDPAAFRTLARHHRHSVYRIIFALIRDRDQARLLAVDTLLRAWREIQHVPHGQSFRLWILRIARSVTLTHQGRRFPSAPRASRVTERADLDRCEEALTAISPEQQHALVLRLAEGMSYADIAATLGVPHAVAISRVAGARDAVFARLNPPPAPRR